MDWKKGLWIVAHLVVFAVLVIRGARDLEVRVVAIAFPLLLTAAFVVGRVWSKGDSPVRSLAQTIETKWVHFLSWGMVAFVGGLGAFAFAFTSPRPEVPTGIPTPGAASPVPTGTAGGDKPKSLLGKAQPSKLKTPPEPAAIKVDSDLYTKNALALESDPTFKGLFEPKRRADLFLVLTSVARCIETSSDADETNRCQIEDELHDALEAKKLSPVFLAVTWFIGKNRIPHQLLGPVNALIDEVTDQPNHGVWAAKKTGAIATDWSALAYWMRIDRIDYAREHTQAKRGSGLGWPSVKKPRRPWMSREKDALVWLGALGALTAEEKERLAELAASKFADEPPEEVSLATLLSEYADNEVRADGLFKGKAIEFTGVVRTVKKTAIGDDISLMIGTGKDFEHPEVHCFVNERFAKKIAPLTAGTKVTVRGRVKGLTMNVIVRDCELVED